MRFQRRKKPGPSKNQKKIQRRAQSDHPTATGPALRQLHPEISSLTIQLAITSPQNVLVQEETRRFTSADATNFACGCPGTCGVGKFDFSEKIGAMVEAQEPQGEASGTCKAEGFGGIPQPCGYAIKCRIEIAF
ncbi:MAG: hypothetical protein ABIJ96_10345 [Elusimicrobiota bacterium]